LTPPFSLILVSRYEAKATVELPSLDKKLSVILNLHVDLNMVKFQIILFL